MKHPPRRILNFFPLLVLAVFFLHGCARHHPPRHLPKEQVRSEQEPAVEPEVEQPGDLGARDIEPDRQVSTRQDHEDRPAPELRPQHGPGQDLFRDAESARRKGQFKKAEMLLERALRIEPRNGWYWHAMGRVQFEQGNFERATQFFLKSDSLAGRDSELQRSNRVLLEQARRRTESSRKD